MNTLEPTILTIFGITGDLAKRKLLPALYNLALDNLLPDSFKIVGLSRQNTTITDVIEIIRTAVIESGRTPDNTALSYIETNLQIVHMDIAKPDDYAELKTKLDAIEDEAKLCMHRLYYLAIPASLFSDVIERIGNHDLNTGCQHNSTESRLLIEKPFGYDLDSAEMLITSLSQYFDEQKTYRIDHYLAKETVQNILTFRFENPLFNGSWDRSHIAHIEVTAAESIGIEGRAAFYEQTGALRDLVQSHLLQLVALVTMERPASMSADDIHAAKSTLLGQIKPIRGNEMDTKTLRGQYDTYRAEVGDEQSQTETFAVIELSIDNDRWADVPVYVRTGKAMAQKVSEIKIVFTNEGTPGKVNYLIIRIQPDEGIIVDLSIKKPGLDNQIQPVKLDFYYDKDLQVTNPDAYERVIVDAIKGDKTLFATSDEVLAGWRIIEPILHAWEHNQSPLHIYKSGTWGPFTDSKLSTAFLYEAGWDDEPAIDKA